MVEKIVGLLMNCLIEKQCIEYDKKDIYAYGLEIDSFGYHQFFHYFIYKCITEAYCYRNCIFNNILQYT